MMKVLINRIHTPQEETRKVSFVISLMVFLLFVTNASYDLQSLIGIPYTVISNICKAVLFFGLLSCLKIIIRNLNNRVYLYLVLIITIFLINFLAVGGEANFLSTIRSHITTVFPMVILICVIKDFDVLNNSLIKVAYLIIPLSFFLLLVRNNVVQGYAMGLANSLTLPVVMMLFAFYRYRKAINIVLACVGSLVILVLGSRGALLGIVVFVLLILLRGCWSRENRFRSIIFILLILIAFIFIDNILIWMSNILGSRGWNSRTLWIMMNDFSHQSGRNEIYSSMIEAIKSNPFKMRGIAGEYAITNGAFAHNFFIELIIDFGIVIGGGTILYVVYRTLSTIYYGITKESNLNMTRLILMSISVPICLVSGTLWTSAYLWMWLFIPNKEKTGGIADE